MNNNVAPISSIPNVKFISTNSRCHEYVLNFVIGMSSFGAVDAGLIVIVAFISPFRADRELARQRFESDEFLEVFVDTPLAICERRDTKGLYVKARQGDITDFTGVSSPYELPKNPELHLDSANLSVEDCIEKIWCKIRKDDEF